MNHTRTGDFGNTDRVTVAILILYQPEILFIV